MADIVIDPGVSIQATINLATPGDMVLLNPGTYDSDDSLIIAKAITVKNNIPATMPIVSLRTVSQWGTALGFAASGITLDGIDIHNIRGGVRYGYYSTLTPLSSLLVQNCRLHDFRRWLFGYGGEVDGFSFLNSKFYNIQDTPFEFNRTKNIVIRNNWFHDQLSSSGEAAITFYPLADVGVCDFSYNYFTGMKYAIEVAPQDYHAASVGSIVVSHNTIDMRLQPQKPINPSSPMCGYSASSFWSAGSYKLDGGAVDWRDNLITRLTALPLYISDGHGLLRPLKIRNCIFWDNFWYYWPNADRHPKELLGFRGNERMKINVPRYRNVPKAPSLGRPSESMLPVLVGWNNDPDRYLFSHDGCIVADPFYSMTGSSPNTFYSLLPGSPAIGAATDGTNIGAWQ